MLYSARLAIPNPQDADVPDFPAHFAARAAVLDKATITDHGPFSNRPVSTVVSPGIKGRRYYAEDTGLEYLDTGTGWVDLGARAASGDLASNLPSPWVEGEVGSKPQLEWSLNPRISRTYLMPRGQGNGGVSMPNLQRVWVRNLNSDANNRTLNLLYFSRNSVEWQASTAIFLKIWKMGESGAGYSEVVLYGGYNAIFEMRVLKATGPHSIVPRLWPPEVLSGTLTRALVSLELLPWDSALVEITHAHTVRADANFTTPGQIYFDGTEVAPNGSGMSSQYGDDGALLTAFPANHLWNGREVLIQTAAMAALGVVWKFRYNANSASAYKWEFIGGPPMINADPSVIASVSKASLTWVGINADDPKITLPFNGEYIARNSASLANFTSAGGFQMGLRINAVDPVVSTDVAAESSTINDSCSLIHSRRILAATAGSVVEQRYRHSGTDPSNIGRLGGSLEIVPLRCS